MTPEIEKFIDLPVGMQIAAPTAIENGMFRSEIKELWAVCEFMMIKEANAGHRYTDPMSRIPGGSKAYPHIAKALFYWRRGEGWRVKRKPHWAQTLKQMFPKTLA